MKGERPLSPDPWEDLESRPPIWYRILLWFFQEPLRGIYLLDLPRGLGREDTKALSRQDFVAVFDECLVGSWQYR